MEVNVESTKIIGRGRRGKCPTYLMRGYVKYEQKGLIRSRIKKEEFTAQVNAISGKIIEFVKHSNKNSLIHLNPCFEIVAAPHDLIVRAREKRDEGIIKIYGYF